jgi:hypothetical protein
MNVKESDDLMKHCTMYSWNNNISNIQIKTVDRCFGMGSKQEICAKWLISSRDHLDGIAPLHDSIKMNFTEMNISVGVDTAYGLECGGSVSFQGSGFPL